MSIFVYSLLQTPPNLTNIIINAKTIMFDLCREMMNITKTKQKHVHQKKNWGGQTSCIYVYFGKLFQ